MRRTNYLVVSVPPQVSSTHRLHFVTRLKASRTVKPLATSVVEMLIVWKMDMYPMGNGAERPSWEEVWVSVCICWKEKTLLLHSWISLVLPGAGCTKQLSSAYRLLKVNL